MCITPVFMLYQKFKKSLKYKVLNNAFPESAYKKKRGTHYILLKIDFKNKVWGSFYYE